MPNRLSLGRLPRRRRKELWKVLRSSSKSEVREGESRISY